MFIITGIITARKELAAFYNNIFLTYRAKKYEMQKYQKIFDFYKFLILNYLKISICTQNSITNE